MSGIFRGQCLAMNVMFSSSFLSRVLYMEGVEAPEEVEQVLLIAHEAIAKLKLFVATQEAINKAEKEAGRNPNGADVSADAAEAVEDTGDLFDGLLEYIRGTVSNALNGGTRAKPARIRARSPPPHGSRHIEAEAAQLRSLLRATISELEAERAEKHALMNEVRQFNKVVDDYRRDNNVLQVYKDRIVELQAVINGTKRPGEVGAEIGESRLESVPADVVLTADQKRKEVANELARLATQARDKSERFKAENMKLQAEKVSLIGQNSILVDRVKVLEAQLSVLTASSSVALRELSKQRLQAAMAIEAPNAVRRQLQTGEVRVGGVTMEAEVAIWLKNMYTKLLNDPEASKTLMSVKDDPAAGSTTLPLNTSSATTGEGTAGYNNPDASRPVSSQSELHPRATSAAGSTGGRSASGGRRPPSRATSGPSREKAQGKSFSQFVATLDGGQA